MTPVEQRFTGHTVTALRPDEARRLGYDVDADVEGVMLCTCGWIASGSQRRVKLRRWTHLVAARL